MDKNILNKKPEETNEQYLWRIGCYIDDGTVSSWKDISDIINEQLGTDKNFDTFRRTFCTVKRYYDNVFEKSSAITAQLEEIKKEKVKLQTLNVERSRQNRHDARRELFYEQIGRISQSLPVPEFKYVDEEVIDFDKEYVLCIADIHAGAKFTSLTNKYSLEIMNTRFDWLSQKTVEFVKKHSISHLTVLGLGDFIQGIIHYNDLKINDSSVSVAIVEVAHSVAAFLNCISEYVDVDYYHVNSSNHTQLRPLGSPANELMDEDVEYVIGHYIDDLCRDNKRIHVKSPKIGEWFTRLDINGFDVIAMHGHQIKNISNILRDISMKENSIVDYLIVGHMHTSKEISDSEGSTHDTEVLVCPSFIGADPYADSIFKGSKPAVKIFGFDKIYGHTESYKIIL